MFVLIRKDWRAHLLPLTTIALALAMLILTPFWAWQWYHSPFLGLLLEPNNVVSQIMHENWPPATMGILWSDQLVAVNGQKVGDSAQIQTLLNQDSEKTFMVTFYRQSMNRRFSLPFLLIRPDLWDLITLFIVPYLVGAVFLGIGLWAYRLRPDFRPTRAFVIFNAAVCLLTTTFLDMNTTHHAVLLWGLSLPLAGASLTYLALVFPQEVRLVRRWPRLPYLALAAGLGLAAWIARDILLPPTPWAYIDSWRWGYIFILSGMVLLGIFLIGRVLGNSSAMVRQQSRVIIFGATLSFLPIIIFYFVPIVFEGKIPEFRAEFLFPPLILLPLSVMYAILRYRLLDVDRWLGRALTYVLTTGAALAAFFLLLTAASLLFQQTVQASDPFIVAAYLLLMVLGLLPLRDFIQRAIDRLFYRSQADYRRILSRLSSDLVNTPDLERTLSLLEMELNNALAPEKFIVFLFQDAQQVYLPHAAGQRLQQSFRLEDALPQKLARHQTPFWISPERDLPPELASIEALGYQVFVPLRYEGRLNGFLALGPRRSGEPYTSDDLEFLTAVAGQSALALENARLFVNLRRTLDETLEMKNLMDDIFASVATGIITTDVNRKITLFNRAAEDILGVKLVKALGKPLDEALPGTALETIAGNVLLNGTTTHLSELTPHSESRGDLVLRLSASPLKDAHLATKGATIVFEDLTETRKIEKERETIRQTFGRVVAPRVRDRLLSSASNLQLDGARATVSMLFADLSGFTSFSETHQAEDVFHVLNTYLDIAAQAILEEEGTLDKFMGDAVMAMWNSPDPQPDHALRACRAALRIVERARALHARFADPDFHRIFRVGVTTGAAMIGNVGTSQLFNYTAIGDTVNMAQRLQASAQPGQIYIHKATYNSAADSLLATQMEALTVKGRAQPVEVYLLQGLK
ncbi:MAG: hypothetical protein Fur0035_03640 [Anaerolineales bacterium]